MDKNMIPNFLIIPSMTCQSSCSYCFGPRQGPVISPEMVARTVKFIEDISAVNDHDPINITFHGGEPLMAGHSILNDLLTRLSDAFRNKKLNFGIQSNLWLLDDKFCELFKQYNVRVGTSLDGPKEITDAQRGEGYFEKTMAGINKLRSYDMDASCIATFTRFGMARWKEAFHFFVSEKLDFSIHAALPKLNDKNTIFSPGSSEFGKFLCDMLDHYIEFRREISVSTLDQIIKGFMKGCGQVCTFMDCAGMFLAIDPAGDIYSCQRFCGNSEYLLGSINNNPSLDDLNRSEGAAAFKKHALSALNECANCSHVNYCKGGCPYNSISSVSPRPGMASFRDPYCEAYMKVYDHIKERLITEMASDENVEAITDVDFGSGRNPLLRRGGLIELAKEGRHPKDIARNARRLVAAVEFAKNDDIGVVASKLADMGICRNKQSALNSLDFMKERLFPTHRILNNLYLHITYDCQLKCKHCYVDQVKSDSGQREMPVENIEKILLDAQKFNFHKFVVTGGEPLMHSDRAVLFKMLSKYKNRSLRTKIVLRTNFAIPLESDEIKDILYSFDRIVISVDGGEEAHDDKRGKGTYAMILRNLEKCSKIEGLSDNAADIVLSSLIYPDESRDDHLSDLHELAGKYRFKKIRVNPLLPLGRANDGDRSIALCGPSGSGDPRESLEKEFIPVSGCGLGHNIYIGPSGDSFPCHATRNNDSYLGNVINGGLSSVIDSDRFKELSGHNVDNDTRCSGCEIRYICGGICRAWRRDDYFNCDTYKSSYIRLYEEAKSYLDIQ